MKVRRSVRIAFAAIIAILIGVSAAWHHFSRRLHLEPWQHLAHVVQLEKSGTDLSSLQALGWSLTILGRDDEVRALEFYPSNNQPDRDAEIDETSLRVVPWREGIRRIASEHRIVMIMENHCASKHREFIGAALQAFHDARFTHYAAEAIGPDDNALSERGYPSSRTGLYTSDPRFGNALRRALDLNFTVLGYDFRPLRFRRPMLYRSAKQDEISVFDVSGLWRVRRLAG